MKLKCGFNPKGEEDEVPIKTSWTSTGEKRRVKEVGYELGNSHLMIVIDWMAMKYFLMNVMMFL